MSRTLHLAALSLVLAWATSIMLPVATFGPGADETWQGWALLMLGWIGVLTGQVGWFANAGFALCLLFLLRHRRPGRIGLAIGTATAALSLHSLGWTWIVRNEGARAAPSPILAYHAGYWLWIAATASAGVLLVAYALATRPVRIAAAAR